MQYSSNANYGCRILEYTHNNATYIRMENEVVALNICADKGTDITDIVYKPMDLNFMWKSSSAKINDFSKHISSISSQNGNNLDYYMGGWHEVFPGGGPYTSKGAELGLHGELTLLTWQFKVLKDTKEEISVEFYTYTIRTPFKVTKKITIKEHSTQIDFYEEIENLSGVDLEYMWGHHPVVGKPFLNEDCEINIEADYFIRDSEFEEKYSHFERGMTYDYPLSKGKDGKEYSMNKVGKAPNGELIYFPEIREGRASVVNHKLNIGIAFSWDKGVFDTIWCWKVLNAVEDYPWYLREYCLGLEFWTGYPKFEECEKNRRLKTIKGNTTIKTGYKCEILVGKDIK